jgi:hypothetical protein
MSIVNTIKCDICGRIKGETNHWLKMSNNSSRFTVIVPIATVEYLAMLDICSHECAVKAFQAWLDKGSKVNA